jgi:AcrR family transcriptional regulator
MTSLRQSGVISHKIGGLGLAQTRAVRTRRLIISAAATVFDECGYGAATVSDVLAKAGTTRGALYFHFPSKEALARALLVIPLEVGRLPVQVTRLQELVDLNLVMVHRLRLDPIARSTIWLALEQSIDCPERAAPFLGWMDQLTRLLERAREHGELLPHVAPAETAELMTSTLIGMLGLSRVLGSYQELGNRMALHLRHLLPSIAVPAVLPVMDVSADRGERLHMEHGRCQYDDN